MIPAVPRGPILEIACFNEASAMIAAGAGADRIELCKDYHLGGLSADKDILEKLKSQLTLPIYTMLRPHAEGFCYEEFDFEVMKQTLNSLKSCGADGFVFGILNRSSQKPCDPNVPWVDVSRNKQLVQLADGRPCTFHRAFDVIPESHWENALSDIMECGFTSILTNGGASGTRAMECVDKLKTLVRYRMKLQSNRVPEIIVGGGVRASNIGLLHNITGASAFHSAALLVTEEVASATEVFKMKDEITRAK
ncbi:hypothetical protein N7516_005639 [Penicillium verrucosum]|uniref:uncharacterized protein n=1 Tax=Penicillium verrucosum TaxID=60171 RepID=UPI0025453200|nr:uncharacterized protein N7516_005639 [Penicillium verrucosum]KAJ5945471.1 hypothetical protein N7516_005639 [Penicillium verrucosum]